MMTVAANSALPRGVGLPVLRRSRMRGYEPMNHWLRRDAVLGPDLMQSFHGEADGKSDEADKQRDLSSRALHSLSAATSRNFPYAALASTGHLSTPIIASVWPPAGHFRERPSSGYFISGGGLSLALSFGHSTSRGSGHYPQQWSICFGWVADVRSPSAFAGSS